MPKSLSAHKPLITIDLNNLLLSDNITDTTTDNMTN